jgi:hypothetical protein
MTFQPKANYVPPAANAHKELRALLGFSIKSAKRDPSPRAKDRSIHNKPARQGWTITLNGWVFHLDSSQDVRDPRLLNVWRMEATRHLGNVDPLPFLGRAQARQVLILLHQIAEAP